MTICKPFMNHIQYINPRTHRFRRQQAKCLWYLDLPLWWISETSLGLQRRELQNNDIVIYRVISKHQKICCLKLGTSLRNLEYLGIVTVRLHNWKPATTVWFTVADNSWWSVGQVLFFVIESTKKTMSEKQHSPTNPEIKTYPNISNLTKRERSKDGFWFQAFSEIYKMCLQEPGYHFWCWTSSVSEAARMVALATSCKSKPRDKASIRTASSTAWSFH